MQKKWGILSFRLLRLPSFRVVFILLFTFSFHTSAEAGGDIPAIQPPQKKVPVGPLYEGITHVLETHFGFLKTASPSVLGWRGQLAGYEEPLTIAIGFDPEPTFRQVLMDPRIRTIRHVEVFLIVSETEEVILMEMDIDMAKGEAVGRLFEGLKELGISHLRDTGFGDVRVARKAMREWRRRAKAEFIGAGFLDHHGSSLNYFGSSRHLGMSQSFQVHVQLLDSLKTNTLLCLMTYQGSGLLGGSRQQGILLGISSEESFSVFRSLLRDIKNKSSGKIFRLFSDFDTGVYYNLASVKYRKNRPFKFARSLQSLGKNIEVTGQALRLSDLNDPASVVVAEYLARSFEREYPFYNDVIKTLQRVRESMYGLINFERDQLDENIELRSAIRKMLKALDTGLYHAEFSARLKEVFLRETVRALKRPR